MRRGKNPFMRNTFTMPSIELETPITDRAAAGSANPRAAALQSYGLLYGSSPAMQELYEQIERVASTDATALIIGESGTGKELIARTIHEQSTRKDAPFIAVNCGAIPDELIEPNCSATRRAASRVRFRAAWATSNMRTAARCFWTRSRK